MFRTGSPERQRGRPGRFRRHPPTRFSDSAPVTILEGNGHFMNSFIRKLVRPTEARLRKPGFPAIGRTSKRFIHALVCLWVSALVAYGAGTDLRNGFKGESTTEASKGLTWNTPSKSSFGSMPLGNGDIGLNVWVEEDGELLFYISKVDAFDAAHKQPKLGRVRVTLRPNPFAAGEPFNQTLLLRDGTITISAGSGKGKVDLRIWVDANQPVVRVVSESAEPLDSVVTLETVSRNLTSGASAAELARKLPKEGTAGVTLDDRADRVVWCYRNTSSVWKQYLLRQCPPELAAKFNDPLLNLTSGGLIEGEGWIRDRDRSLRLKDKSRKFGFSVHVLSTQTAALGDWFSKIEQQAFQAKQLDREKALAAHKQWWNAFWDRSHIIVEGCGDSPVSLDDYRFTLSERGPGDFGKSQVMDSRENAFNLTQCYALERFTQACASRGQVPLLWNGSIFTMDMPARTHYYYAADGLPYAVGADTRVWDGLCFLWQNTRHPYWSMLARGDYDTMLPAFRVARGSLEVDRAQCKHRYKHDGAYLSEVFLWGGPALVDSTHLQYHFVASLEIAAMMCDYYEHTQDRRFAEEFLLPCVDEFVKFFELHYPKRDKRGKMLIEPAGLVETYQPVSNPATEVSGLRYLLARLTSLDEGLIGKERKSHWTEVLRAVPDVPVRRVKGIDLLGLADKFLDNYPASYCWGPSYWCKFHNLDDRKVYRSAGGDIFETPELYAVFPFRQACVGNDECLPGARQSFHVRQLSLDGTPDYVAIETSGMLEAPAWAAHLGLAREAARLVSVNLNGRIPNWHPRGPLPAQPDHLRPRFPAFWEGFSIIDCDHGGASANGIQSMLLESDAKKIYLLPAWPEDWDVSFKLCAPQRTTVECVYRGGKVQSLAVTPASRQADIVDMASLENRVRTLVSVACADRNYRFDLPPMLDGQVLPADIKRLKTTGPWLEKHGQSLYGTKSGPWEPGKWGGSLFKDNVIYLHALNWPGDVLKLPALGRKIVQFECLTGGSPKVVQTPGDVTVSMEAKDRNPIDTIVKLTCDGPVESCALAAPCEGSLTTGKKVVASNWMNGFEPQKAIDADATTAWMPQQVDGQVWLEVDLGTPETFDRVEIHIENASHVFGQAYGFTIECKQPDGSWKRCWQGGIYGRIFAMKYEAVTAQFVRLNISAAGVRQFDLFRPANKETLP